MSLLRLLMLLGVLGLAACQTTTEVAPRYFECPQYELCRPSYPDGGIHR